VTYVLNSDTSSGIAQPALSSSTHRRERTAWQPRGARGALSDRRPVGLSRCQRDEVDVLAVERVGEARPVPLDRRAATVYWLVVL